MLTPYRPLFLQMTFLNTRNLLHDPHVYADPMTFNPDRFMTTADKEAERDPRDFAFGFGRRYAPTLSCRQAFS